MLRFQPLFRVGAWVLIAAGIWYLYLAARNVPASTRVWVPLLIIGVVALAVGASLLRWLQRAGE